MYTVVRGFLERKPVRVLEDGCVVVFGAGDEAKRADEMQESRWGGLEWNGWNVPFTPPSSSTLSASYWGPRSASSEEERKEMRLQPSLTVHH